ncbi:MAG: hypothetical protein ABR562_03400 [Thermoplasmatota archaeon]
MVRLQPVPQVQEEDEEPEEVVALEIPIPAPRRRKAVKPVSPVTTAPPIEELLVLDLPRQPQKQRCLAILMQTTGHSLDRGCRLCFTACVYAAPCGCGGWDCIDRLAGEAPVLFMETVRPAPRGWRRLFAKREEPSPVAKAISRLLRPWTWFRAAA